MPFMDSNDDSENFSTLTLRGFAIISTLEPLQLHVQDFRVLVLGGLVDLACSTLITLLHCILQFYVGVGCGF